MGTVAAEQEYYLNRPTNAHQRVSTYVGKMGNCRIVRIFLYQSYKKKPDEGFALIHWMATNITSNKLLEDVGRNGPDFVQGVSNWICVQGGDHSGEICGRYGGMVSPEGHGTYVYEIKVRALDIMLDLKDGFHLDQMYYGMEGHTPGETMLKGKYTNQVVRP